MLSQELPTPPSPPGAVVAPAPASDGEKTAPASSAAGIRPRRRLIPRVTVARMVIALVVLAGLAVGGYFEGRYLWAQREFREGKKELERSHYLKARAHFDLGLQVCPNDVEIRVLNARAYRMSGDFVGAKGQLDACRSLPDPEGRVELARQLLSAQSDSDFLAWDKKLMARLDQGIDEEAILEVLATKGLRYQLIGYVMEMCERLQKVNSKNTSAIVWQGQAMAQANNTEKAISYLQQALAQDPDMVPARALLVQMLTVEDRKTEALQQAQIVYQTDHDNTDACLQLARCYRMVGRFEEALPLLETCLRVRPRDRASTVERALVQCQLGTGTKETEEWLRRALALSPKEREVLFALSRCLQQRNSERDESASAAAVVCGGPLAQGAYTANTEAGALAMQGAELERGYDELKVIEHKIQRSPKSVSLHMQAADLCQKLGYATESLKWLRQALVLSPNNRQIQLRLAHQYEDMGDILLYRYYREQAERQR
jgi:tetratricopeptide (TPR) repeat protein